MPPHAFGPWAHRKSHVATRHSLVHASTHAQASSQGDGVAGDPPRSSKIARATTVVINWLEIYRLHVPIEFRVDGLTTMMLSMVPLPAKKR